MKGKRRNEGVAILPRYPPCASYEGRRGEIGVVGEGMERRRLNSRRALVIGKWMSRPPPTPSDGGDSEGPSS